MAFRNLLHLLPTITERGVVNLEGLLCAASTVMTQGKSSILNLDLLHRRAQHPFVRQTCRRCSRSQATERLSQLVLAVRQASGILMEKQFRMLQLPEISSQPSVAMSASDFRSTSLQLSLATCVLGFQGQ